MTTNDRQATQLADRIDATRATQPPPPKRRYRLVLDLDADTVTATLEALNEVYEAIAWAGATSCTSGSSAAGFHFEFIDHGEHVTHESFRAAVADWSSKSKETPDA